MLAETQGLCKANVIAPIFISLAPKWSLIPMRGQKAMGKAACFLKEGPNRGLCVRVMDKGRGGLHCPGRMQEKAIPE